MFLQIFECEKAILIRMNEFLGNRYVRLGLLTLGIGLLFWMIIWVVLRAVGLDDFPVGLQLAVAFLGAGLLVAQILARRVF